MLDSLQWTAAPKRDVKQYGSGMALVFHQDDQDFTRHAVVEVVDVDHKKKTLSVKNEAGQVKDFQPLKGMGFDVCERREIAVAPGDKLLLQANRSEQKLVNGELVVVKAVEAGRITFSDGRAIEKDFRQFCHGYAVTSHASQGKTVDEVILVASSRSLPAVHQQQFYVSISRGRDRARIFTDDKELLRQHVGRAHDRRAVLDELAPALLGIPAKQTAKKKIPAMSQETGGRFMRPLRPEMFSRPSRLPKMQELVRLASSFRSWVKSVSMDREAQRMPEPARSQRAQDCALPRQRVRQPEMTQGFGPEL